MGVCEGLSEVLRVGGRLYVLPASNALPCQDLSSPAPAYRDATSCLPNSSLLTAPPCAPQLRQRVGEDAGAKGSSSKSGGSKSGSSKGAAEEEDSGYQDAQDALEEMIEEVGYSGTACLDWGGAESGPGIGTREGRSVHSINTHSAHARWRFSHVAGCVPTQPNPSLSRRRRSGSWRRLRTCWSTTCSGQPTRRCACV